MKSNQTSELSSFRGNKSPKGFIQAIRITEEDQAYNHLHVLVPGRSLMSLVGVLLKLSL